MVERFIQVYNEYMDTILFMKMYMYHCCVVYISTITTVHADYNMGPVVSYVYSIYWRSKISVLFLE